MTKPLLIVEWLDAGIIGGWVSKKKRPTYMCKTVGWEVDRNDQYIFIAGTITEQNVNVGHADLSSIPLGCVTNITEVHTKNAESEVSKNRETEKSGQ